MTQLDLENIAALCAARDRLRAALLSNFDADSVVMSRELRAVIATISRIRRIQRRRADR